MPLGGRRQRRSPLLTVVLVTQLVVALVTAAVVYVGWRRLDANLQAGASIHHTQAKSVPAKDRKLKAEPLNILVMGTDSRGGGGDRIDNQAGCDCSDTTILVHVAADRRSAYGVSIPRDALVKPVTCTRDHQYLGTGLVEWNQAYAAGGPACTADQLEQDFHVYVDDYVVLDFNGFTNMVNAIGGVNVCIPFELSDPTYAKVDFQPNPSAHLDGTAALAYVRLRHVLAGTDIGRIRRQQAFVSAMVDQLVSAGTLTRPDRLYRFADALTRSITTDPGLAHVDELITLAEQFRHIDVRHIRFITLPNQSYDVPMSDVRWGRVQVLPAAYRLMRLVGDDAPLGALAKDAVHAGKRPGHASAAAKAAAAAAGVCA